jgi:hypothetical protein
MLNMRKGSKFECAFMHIQLLCMLIIDIHEYIQPTLTKFSNVLQRTNTYKFANHEGTGMILMPTP